MIGVLFRTPSATYSTTSCANIQRGNGIIYLPQNETEQRGANVNISTLIAIVVGLVVLGLIWRVVKGVIRLVLMVGIVLLILYVLTTGGLPF
jgi:hypothetical protein